MGIALLAARQPREIMTDISDYEYDLPKELIAQHPLACRSDSRLMVVDRASGEIHHAHTRDLPDWVRANDAMVFNDSRVIPARLVGRRELTGGKWEGLFLNCDAEGNWKMLCKTRGKMSSGESITLSDRDSHFHCPPKPSSPLVPHQNVLPPSDKLQDLVCLRSRIPQLGKKRNRS